jgi:hypothetical protein
MIANYRNDIVWRHMRQCVPLRRGLERAGFRGGWLGTDVRAAERVGVGAPEN